MYLAHPAAGLRVEVAASLAGVAPAAWDALAGDDSPFVEHAFLRLLETSGSVGDTSGWSPRYVLAHDGATLVGATAAYVKTHSYGEYIFDWGWAQAAQRAGIDYYPKLVVAVPFTPASGPRLLVHPEADAEAVRAALAGGIEGLVRDERLTGAHVLCCGAGEAEWLARRGWASRLTHQYHWHNPGYRTFDDFLAALRAPARKQIRRERERVHAEAEVTMHRGDEVDAATWQILYRLYVSTIARKWGEPYLSEAFFAGAALTIGARARVVLARRQGRIIAASLSFEKGAHLYGRYWGAFEPVHALHFELCYYRLIEHAIATGKERIEAGAQGEHKIKRGFAPVAVHSAHKIGHAGLHAAVERFVAGEARETEREMIALAAHLPFREGMVPGCQSAL